MEMCKCLGLELADVVEINITVFKSTVSCLSEHEGDVEYNELWSTVMYYISQVSSLLSIVKQHHTIKLLSLSSPLSLHLKKNICFV